MSIQRKTKNEPNASTYTQVASTNLPYETKMLVSEGNIDSIVSYGSDYGMEANYTVTYKKEDDKGSTYTTYEFF